MKCVSSRIACLDFPWDFFSFSCKVCSVNKGNTCYLAVLLLPPVYVCCAWNQCQNLTYLLFWWCKKPLWKGQANGYGVVFDLNYAPGCWCCPPRKHIQGSILVFIPGGRGKDKAWIITFPDNSRFNDVPEETVTKVLTYLTSVPRYVAPFQLSPVIRSVGLTRVGHGIFSATPHMRARDVFSSQSKGKNKQLIASSWSVQVWYLMCRYLQSQNGHHPYYLSACMYHKFSLLSF